MSKVGSHNNIEDRLGPSGDLVGDDGDDVEEGLNCGSRWALGINGPRRQSSNAARALEKSPNTSSSVHLVRYIQFSNAAHWRKAQQSGQRKKSRTNPLKQCFQRHSIRQMHKVDKTRVR